MSPDAFSSMTKVASLPNDHIRANQYSSDSNAFQNYIPHRFYALGYEAHKYLQKLPMHIGWDNSYSLLPIA